MLKGFNFPQGALRFCGTLGCSQIVYRLQVQPELCGAAEVAREPPKTQKTHADRILI